MTFELRSKIFKEEKDYSDWDKYINYIELNPEFDEEKRTTLLILYKFLKKELGTDYIRKCHSDGRNLVNHWITTKGFNYSELKWLYNALSYFKKADCNYIKVIGHIRSDKKCNLEGIPFLIAGDSLRKAGFEVEFEPAIEFIKNPDLKIVNPENGEIIYCEVSKLEESNPRAESSSTYSGLMDIIMDKPPHVPFAGKIHTSSTKEELIKLGELIQSAKEKAYGEKCFTEIDINQTDGIVECAFAHPDQVSLLEKWEERKSCRGLNNLKGLPLDFDETPRIGAKIEKEGKQLPTDHLGIIYLPVNPLYFLFGTNSFSDITNQIKWALKKTPHVIGVCVYSHFGNEAEPLSYVEHDFFQRKMVHENIQQDFLFVLNHNCNIKVYPDTIMKLYSSFYNVYE